MQTYLRRLVPVFLLAAMVLVPLSAVTTPVQAQTSERCFPETGYCISGNIRAYWEANGGLSVFGYPITNVRQQTIENWTGPVQWFERDRLEDHSTDGQGVLAGRLGAQLLELRGTPWETFSKVSGAEPGCDFYPQTGHSLCEPFRSYWINNGGLERFGYPITEPIQETIGEGEDAWTGTVQYFERRRMEYHPENQGTPFVVLLGLLGRTVYNFEPEEAPLVCGTEVAEELQATYNSPEISSFRDEMGCPQPAQSGLLAAVQTMERGQMIWTDTGVANPPIWVYLQYGYYEEFPDTFREGTDPEEPDATAPEGLYLPQRGFGKVWINNPDLINEIGYAREPSERPTSATVQRFDNGVMVWVYENENVLIGGPNEWQAVFIPRVIE
jgi:hypothetical protein